MLQPLRSSLAWCYDLLWFLSDLRYAQPRLFAALIVLTIGLFVAAPVLALTMAGSSDREAVANIGLSESGASAESEGRQYVAYSGLANTETESEPGDEATGAESPEPALKVQRLSDVLRDDIEDSDLIYGSDGSEGSILPLDNGIVPSSGPRFDTTWEIILPSAGIRAAIVQVGLTPDGAMGSPDNPFVFGWFNRSAVPGQLGNALFGGHRDYEDVEGNIDIGVGWEMDETRVGDQLVMRNAATDRYYIYDVVETATIKPDSADAVRYLSQTRESVVTLITCSGDFDEETHSYEDRIVIVALLTAIAESGT